MRNNKQDRAPLVHGRQHAQKETVAEQAIMRTYENKANACMRYRALCEQLAAPPASHNDPQQNTLRHQLFSRSHIDPLHPSSLSK